MKLCIFDLPSMDAPLEERLKGITEAVKKINNPQVIPVEFIKCTGSPST